MSTFCFRNPYRSGELSGLPSNKDESNGSLKCLGFRSCYLLPGLYLWPVLRLLCSFLNNHGLWHCIHCRHASITPSCSAENLLEQLPPMTQWGRISSVVLQSEHYTARFGVVSQLEVFISCSCLCSSQRALLSAVQLHLLTVL